MVNRFKVGDRVQADLFGRPDSEWAQPRRRQAVLGTIAGEPTYIGNMASYPVKFDDPVESYYIRDRVTGAVNILEAYLWEIPLLDDLARVS